MMESNKRDQAAVNRAARLRVQIQKLREQNNEPTAPDTDEKLSLNEAVEKRMRELDKKPDLDQER